MPEEIRTGTRSSRLIFKYARDNSVKNIKFKDYILYFGHQIQRKILEHYTADGKHRS